VVDFQEVQQRLETICLELLNDAKAVAVFLLNRDKQEIVRVARADFDAAFAIVERVENDLGALIEDPRDRREDRRSSRSSPTNRNPGLASCGLRFVAPPSG